LVARLALAPCGRTIRLEVLRTHPCLVVRTHYYGRSLITQ
jgi:hypothetical protein